ncbi:MraY family glycosyltransferase [uncultured Bacteroides sp.]|uniref:MraY family glycosyltransferase n=1 Tax=uncultured Bacteroides sp. TaxID=162156 RepID=UPI002AA7661A|nr:MraY family glycosyltransferase [uncultured Bacteroides sp.]
MNNILLNGGILIFALLIAVTLEMMVLPRIIYIAKKKNIFDIPCARKSHRNPIPRLAGISFFPVLLFVFSVCVLILPDSIVISEPALKRLLGLITGNLLIMGIGIKDDIVGARYKHKMVIQFLASVLLVVGGLYINDFNGLFGVGEVPFWIGAPFTVLLAMFIMNAINLIDGADGLASGIAGVALISFGVLFFTRGLYFYALICVILVGILIPFFYYNVFYPSRKIFMGDTGSLTLGFQLAYLGVRFAMKTPDSNYELFNAPVMIALSAMFIPLFDALRVMVGRALEGKSMFLPDRRHIHHKLLDLGFSHRKVMVSLVLCACLFVLINVLLMSVLNLNIMFALDIILWLGMVEVLNIRLKFIREYEERMGHPVRVKQK